MNDNGGDDGDGDRKYIVVYHDSALGHIFVGACWVSWVKAKIL